MKLHFPRLARLAIVLVFLAGCSPGEEGAGAGDGQAIPEGRLPVDVEPLAYELELRIDPRVREFSGRVDIRLRVDARIERFWMHGRDLRVSDARLETADGEVVAVSYRQVHRDGIVLIELGRPIPPQQARLILEYQGELATDASGLFRVRAGEEHYVFSEFQPIMARSAFPSFDEPRFKTPFSVSIVTPADNGAFSNGPATAVEPLEDGNKRVAFAATQPLPTYLVAFAVGPLDVLEWQPVPSSEWRSEPLPLRGIAARGRAESLRYALANTATMVLELEEYFGIPYPYDKLDLVAVVGYSGAMEHAGLISYDEYTLLLEEGASLARQELFGSTHAHELAHQWLGNLVTMAWWDDLWMNESFASWMEERIMARWRPDMHYARARLGYTHRAMDRDSLASSRSVREPVHDAAGMYDAFDSATYSKGAAVIRMVEEYVGEEAFRRALSDYLRRFEHQSATVFDLIDALEASIGPQAQLQAIFRAFLFQPGVPSVSAVISCDREGGHVSLTQERYIPEGSLAPTDGVWAIPVCLRWNGNGDSGPTETCRLLTSGGSDIGLAGHCPAWLVVNRAAAGYYRWQASGAQQDLLDLYGAALDDLERMAVEDSLAARMRSGTLGAGEYLQAVPVFAAALERAVVTAPLADLEWLLDHAVPEADRGRAREYLGAIYRRRLEFVGLPGGSESAEEARRLRSELVEFLARVVEDEEILRDLADRGRRFVGFDSGELDPDAVEPELVATATAVAAREGGAAFFDHLVGLLATETAPDIREAAVAGIGAVRDPLLVARARNLLLDELIATNEVWMLLDALGHPAVLGATWDWLDGHLDSVLARYPGSYRFAFPAHFDGFCSTRQAGALKARFEPYNDSVPGIERITDQTVEQIRICSAFRERHARDIGRFLRSLGSAEGGGEAPGIAVGPEEG